MNRTGLAITRRALAVQVSVLAHDANLPRNAGLENAAGDRQADWTFETDTSD